MTEAQKLTKDRDPWEERQETNTIGPRLTRLHGLQVFRPWGKGREPGRIQCTVFVEQTELGIWGKQGSQGSEDRVQDRREFHRDLWRPPSY